MKIFFIIFIFSSVSQKTLCQSKYPFFIDSLLKQKSRIVYKKLITEHEKIFFFYRNDYSSIYRVWHYKNKQDTILNFYFIKDKLVRVIAQPFRGKNFFYTIYFEGLNTFYKNEKDSIISDKKILYSKSDSLLSLSNNITK